jgi:hypothetical protein
VLLVGGEDREELQDVQNHLGPQQPAYRLLDGGQPG